MSELLKILLIWLAAFSVIAFALMGIDKSKARRGARRIPEKTLFAFAILGGALGGTVGMYSFHHKTLHKSFAIGFPLLTIVQIAAVAYLIIKFA